MTAAITSWAAVMRSRAARPRSPSAPPRATAPTSAMVSGASPMTMPVTRYASLPAAAQAAAGREAYLVTGIVIGDAPLTIADVVAVARGPRRDRRSHRRRAGRLWRDHRLRPAGHHAHPGRQGPRAPGEPGAQPRRGRGRALVSRGRARRHDHPAQHYGSRSFGRARAGRRPPRRLHQRRPRALGAVARPAGPG